MGSLEGMIANYPDCIKDSQSTNMFLRYLSGAIAGFFHSLDKKNPLHYWSIDDLETNSPGKVKDSKMYIDGTVFWIGGGMNFKSFFAEIQATQCSVDYRIEFLTGRVPKRKDVGERLLIVGTSNRTTLALYATGPGIE